MFATTTTTCCMDPDPKAAAEALIPSKVEQRRSPVTIPRLSKSIRNGLVFGCLSLKKEKEASGEEGVFNLLSRVLAQGCNTFELARGYPEAEVIFGRWLSTLDGNVREELLIITKGGAVSTSSAKTNENLRAGTVVGDLSPEFLEQELQASLEALGVAAVDVYMLHRDEPTRDVDGIVRTMHDWVQRGLVKAWGVSNWSLERLKKAYEYAAEHHLSPPTVDSPQVSLIRPMKEVWSNTSWLTPERSNWYAQHKEDFTVLGWGAFGKGLLQGRWSDEVDNFDGTDPSKLTPPLSSLLSVGNVATIKRAKEVAKKRGASLAQVSLAYLQDRLPLQERFTLAPIVGTNCGNMIQELLDRPTITAADFQYIRPHLVVYGCGAIGTHLAFCASEAGADVTAILRDTDVRLETGLRIRFKHDGPDAQSQHLQYVRATSNPASITKTVDYLMIGLKTYAMKGIQEDLKVLPMHENTIIFPPTSSISTYRSDMFTNTMGRREILTYWLSAKLEDVSSGRTCFVTDVHGGYILNEPEHVDQELNHFAALLKTSGTKVTQTAHAVDNLWLKSLNSLVFNVVALETGWTLGEIKNSKDTVEQIMTMMKEGEGVLNSLGVDAKLMGTTEERVGLTLSNAGVAHVMSMLRDVRLKKPIELPDIWQGFEKASNDSSWLTMPTIYKSVEKVSDMYAQQTSGLQSPVVGA